jgi:hypothetical protein
MILSGTAVHRTALTVGFFLPGLPIPIPVYFDPLSRGAWTILLKRHAPSPQYEAPTFTRLWARYFSKPALRSIELPRR